MEYQIRKLSNHSTKTKSRTPSKSQSDMSKISKEMKKLNRDIQGAWLYCSFNINDVDKIEAIDTSKEVADLKEKLTLSNTKLDEFRLKSGTFKNSTALDDLKQKLLFEKSKDKLNVAEIKRLTDDNKKLVSKCSQQSEEIKELTESNKSLNFVKKKQEQELKDLKFEWNKLEERAEKAEFKLKDYSSRLVRKNVLYSDLTQELKALCAENKRLVSQRRKSFEYSREIGEDFSEENDKENALFEYAKRIQDANKALHKQVAHLKDENNSKLHVIL